MDRAFLASIGCAVVLAACSSSGNRVERGSLEPEDSATYHQHIFRDRFYDNTVLQGQETIAQFVSNFIAGKIETIGP